PAAPAPPDRRLPAPWPCAVRAATAAAPTTRDEPDAAGTADAIPGDAADGAHAWPAEYSGHRPDRHAPFADRHVSVRWPVRPAAGAAAHARATTRSPHADQACVPHAQRRGRA